MPSNGDSNLDRLRDAGLIMESTIRSRSRSLRLVEGLTPDEVDILVAVKTRLDGAASCAEPRARDSRSTAALHELHGLLTSPCRRPARACSASSIWWRRHSGRQGRLLLDDPQARDLTPRFFAAGSYVTLAMVPLMEAVAPSLTGPRCRRRRRSRPCGLSRAPHPRGDARRRPGTRRARRSRGARHRHDRLAPRAASAEDGRAHRHSRVLDLAPPSCGDSRAARAGGVPPAWAHRRAARAADRPTAGRLPAAAPPREARRAPREGAAPRRSTRCRSTGSRRS